MLMLEKELRDQIQGDIHFDPITRRVYSVDASIFEVEPLGVVIPKTKKDLIKAVRLISSYNIPMTVRGAATGITGSCLGRGIILDISKYLNRILEINIAQGYVVCEPGVVQDELNHQLSSYGYRLGPDTSTGNRATLGGMLANNAAGSRSLYYGRMVDHIKEVELVLAKGDLLRFHSLSDQEWADKQRLNSSEGRIYREIAHIKHTYGSAIEYHFPKIPRHVSGYNLDEIIKNIPLNVSKLIAGSEGTLGIVTEMTLNIVPKAKALGLCLIHLTDMIAGMRWIPELLTFHPMALEMIDDQIIQLGRSSPSMRGQLDWLHGDPQAIFIVEFQGETQQEVKDKLEKFVRSIQERQMGYAHRLMIEPTEMAKVWKLRKAGLGILLSKRTYSRAIAFLEDISVAPEKLADFMDRFSTYLKEKGKWAGIYGHVGSGCMHIRPYMDVRNPDEYLLMRQMMIDMANLLLEYGGALSGEHGDGLIRSWLNPHMFGKDVYQAFIDLKQAFDPDYLMNPGKIISAPNWEELRTEPGKELVHLPTFLNFSRQGGFELAVDLCNGNGLCRKKEQVMCPSFQVTNDEFHSTRARAQALRSIIHGRLPLEDLVSQGMYDVMDLCISCKGCKTECPSQVDMAKMKSEFLYHYQEQHGISLRSRLFGQIGFLNRVMSPIASLFNSIHQNFLVKNVLEKIGISPHRSLPPLAKQRFSSWFKSYKQPVKKGKQVVLFNDTFNEFNHPDIGQATVKILNAMNYEVLVPEWRCCGRPAISKGMLKQAKKQVFQLIEHLTPYLSLGLPIIGLEPSCILTIKDDYFDFMLDEKDLSLFQRLASSCYTLDEFLAQHVNDEGLIPSLPLKNQTRLVRVHGHCHQKSLIGMGPTLKVLNAIPGFSATELQSGCCGMAGSFGYEAEHYDISMKMGELCVLPAVRNSAEETLWIASGTSCRQQIADGTHRRAIHLAEAILQQME